MVRILHHTCPQLSPSFCALSSSHDLVLKRAPHKATEHDTSFEAPVLDDVGGLNPFAILGYLLAARAISGARMRSCRELAVKAGLAILCVGTHPYFETGHYLTLLYIC